MPHIGKVFGPAIAGIAIIAALAAVSAAADDGDELVALINAYRAVPHRCEAREVEAAGAVAANPLLVQPEGLSGKQLLQRLKAAGYAAARLETISVSGATDPADTMAF